MSKFYGQVEGQAQTTASRRGSQYIKVSAQSWDGSVITKLTYSDDGKLIVQLDISDGSEMNGYTYFSGTLEELKKALGIYKLCNTACGQEERI